MTARATYMKEIPLLLVFHLREFETPKTFKIHGNNTSHNFDQITVFAAQDDFWRNFTTLN